MGGEIRDGIECHCVGILPALPGNRPTKSRMFQELKRRARRKRAAAMARNSQKPLPRPLGRRRGSATTILFLACAARLLPSTLAVLPLQPNRTTVECPQPAISGEERANCTITTRDDKGEPAAGANAEDFRVFHAPELLEPSPIQGGPIHWFVEFATCKAGWHNVTIQHAGEFNATRSATS